MTEDESKLIESQFTGLANIFETKLTNSEDKICEKIKSLDEKFVETRKIVDKHVNWHENINNRIIGFTVKCMLALFGVVIVVSLFYGLNNGFITTVLAKMIG